MKDPVLSQALAAIDGAAEALGRLVTGGHRQVRPTEADIMVILPNPATKGRGVMRARRSGSDGHDAAHFVGHQYVHGRPAYDPVR